VSDSEDFQKRERELQKMRDELKALQKKIASSKKSGTGHKSRPDPKRPHRDSSGG
jgi:Skp family chaperone for outer membrane proteins